MIPQGAHSAAKLCSSASHPTDGSHLGEHGQGALAGVIRSLVLRIHGDQARDGGDEEDLLAELTRFAKVRQCGGNGDREVEP